MANNRELNVSVSGQQAQVLRDAVESGEYATPGDIVHEAISVWQAHRAVEHDDNQWLQRSWDEGKASGEPQPIDFEDLRREARRRLAAIQANAD